MEVKSQPTPITKEYKDKFISSLRTLYGDDKIQDLLEKLENSKFKKLKFLELATGTKQVLVTAPNDAVKDSLAIKHVKNFNVPIHVDTRLAPNNKRRDIITLNIRKEQTSIDQLCEKVGHITALDVIKVGTQKGVISKEQREKIIEGMDYRVQKSIPQFYSFISNRLANGVLEKDNFQSYRRKSYPLGIPGCTGCEKSTRSLLNLFYVAVEQKTSSNGRPTIIQQVSTDLEDVEDTHAACDVDIARNENVRRHISEYGFDYVYTEPDTSIEFEKCFGEKGEIILKLAEIGKIHEKVVDFIEKTLYKRSVGLGFERLTHKPKWSRDLERVLPPTRAQFKRPPKIINDYQMYMNISTPITYNVENVTFLNKIVEKYFAKRLSSMKPPTKEEINAWKRVLVETVKQLRTPSGSPALELTYGRAALLVAAGILCVSFDVTREMSALTESGRKIPTEIGITDQNMAGAERVMDLAVDFVINKGLRSKDYIQEIAGLFRVVDINQVTEFIKALTLTIKAIKYCATDTGSEAPIVKAQIADGIITMSPLYGDGAISISLERFIPNPRKERR